MKSIALSAVLLIFIGLIFTSLFFDSNRTTGSGGGAPVSQTGFAPLASPPATSNGGAVASSTPAPNPSQDFRGPTGQPRVIGPGAPPPNY